MDRDQQIGPDDAGDKIKITEIEEYESRDIIRYELKEDWFFDKQRSVLDVRIIGISPVVFSKNPETLEIDGLKNQVGNMEKDIKDLTDVIRLKTINMANHLFNFMVKQKKFINI